MYYLKQSESINLQSHHNIKIEYSREKINCFYGDNSNGKSVIGKTIYSTLDGQLSLPRVRRSLKNRNAKFGELILTRSDDMVLTIHIEREARDTYLELSGIGRRYLADKNYLELMFMFGFHYDSETGISLNYCDKHGISLIIDDKPSTNAKLFNSVIKDEYAERRRATLNELLIESQAVADKFRRAVTIDKITLETLAIPDLPKLEEERKRIEQLYFKVKHFNFEPMPTIVPKIDKKILNFEPMPEIRYRRLLVLDDTVPDLSKEALELQMLKDGQCPVCRRKLYESSCNDHT